MNRKTACDEKIQCSKCGKTFTQDWELERHMNRKTPCEPIVGGVPPVVKQGENKCKFCGRVSASADALRKHLQKCRIAANKKVYTPEGPKAGRDALFDLTPNDVTTAVASRDDILIAMMQNMQQDFKQMKNEISELKQNQNKPNVVVNNTINGNVNIQINVFTAKPYMEGIDFQRALSLLKKPDHEIISEITEMIHGDQNLPQNHNIYMLSPKENQVMIFSGDEKKKEWTKTDLRKAYSILMKHGVDLLYKADDELSAMNKLLSDEDGDRFEMLINKQRSNSIYDEDIEAIKPVLVKLKMIAQK
jgi:hypothetical protein